MVMSLALLDKHFQRSPRNSTWEAGTSQQTGFWVNQWLSLTICVRATQWKCHDSILFFDMSEHSVGGGKPPHIFIGCTEVIFFTPMQWFFIFMTINHGGSFCGPKVDNVVLREPEADRGKQMPCWLMGPAPLLCLKFLRCTVTSEFHFSRMGVKGSECKCPSIISSE